MLLCGRVGTMRSHTKTSNKRDLGRFGIAGNAPEAPAQGAVGFDRAGTTFNVMCMDEGRAAAATAFGDEVKAADSMSGS